MHADRDLSFRLVADSAPVPMWVTRLDRQRLFVNRAYMSFLGCSYEDAVAFDWRSVIHPDDVDDVVAQSIAGEASLKPFTLEGRYRRADGEWRWISSVSNPRWDQDGNHCGFIGVAHDITESKTAELAVREREAQLSAFISQSSAGFAQVDLDGRFTLVSDKFCVLTGWSREQLLKLRMQDITHPDDRARNMPLFAATATDGTPFTIDKRYVRPDGTHVWVNNSVALIKSSEDKPYRILAVTIDISARRESEMAQRRASESIRLAIEGAGMSSWELDLDTMEGPWSQNRFEMLGYSPTADGRAPYDAWFKRVHPEDRERADLAARACFNDGTPFQIEYRILRADNNEERWLQSNGSVINITESQRRRFVGISFDITERKRAESHQQLLIDELNHRVKNTLGIVQSIAQQSIRKGGSPQEIARSFEGRLTALSSVHNLLTSEFWQPTPIHDLVTACLRPLARAEQIQIEGPALVLSTKTAITLALALHELATNAIKYGALSTVEGIVCISWNVDETCQLELCWIESGGPVVKQPEREGFGMRMIKRGLATEFRGSVEMKFDPEGLICRLTARVPEFSA